ncbi:MAG: putative selenium-dependent hydroxylase accessory protein YqeC [Rubrobacter sp.]|nr:putative selenium-dependent hydroxylase accessory protein YqeC [Rubrobacter sp.]
MELYGALGIIEGDVVAFVGAGGKSGAILQIVGELEEAGTPVLVAPTTKMFVSEAEEIGPVLTSEDGEDLRSKVEESLAGGGAAVAGSAILSKNRMGGVEPSWVPALAPQNGVTLVEADGSRRRPLKGTAAHEPLLPGGVTLVVAVGGIRALGKPVDEEHVHRPEVFSKLTGTGPGHTIDARAFANALLAGFHNIPDGVRRAALLTDVEPGRSMARASVIAHGLWRGGVRKVVFSSLPDESPGRVWVL